MPAAYQNESASLPRLEMTPGTGQGRGVVGVARCHGNAAGVPLPNPRAEPRGGQETRPCWNKRPFVYPHRTPLLAASPTAGTTTTRQRPRHESPIREALQLQTAPRTAPALQRRFPTQGLDPFPRPVSHRARAAFGRVTVWQGVPTNLN